MSKETESNKDIELLLTLMDKAVRQFMLYGRNHPQFASASNDFYSRLKDFFTSHSVLDLNVKRTEIQWGGKKVYEVSKKDGNYIQQMYVDGIRRLEILPSVEVSELEDFVSVLGRDVQSYESQEDDTTTLLWKLALPNVKTETIDIYASDRLAILQQDDLSQQNLSEEDKKNKDYFDNMIYKLLGYETESPSENTPPTFSKKSHSAFQEEIKTPATEEFFHLTETERKSLDEEIEKIRNRDYLSEIVVIFNEVFEVEKDTQNFPLLLQVYTDAIGNFMDKGELGKASTWLKSLRASQMKIGQTNLDAHELIEEEISRIASSERLANLGKQVAEGKFTNPKEWVTLFSYLGEKAAASICEFLSHVPQESIHESVRTFLMEQAKGQTDVYLAYLKKAQWQIVRDMVRILSSLLDAQVLSTVFKHVAIHPAPDVRSEVLRHISKYSPDFRANLLKRGISDSSESVRALCFGIIVRDPIPELAKIIAEQVPKPDFLEKTANEKRVTLLALAQCGGTGTLKFLNEIVEDSGTTPAHDELRMAALQAIAAVQDPKADEILQDWAKKSFFQKSLRDAARRLLERRTPIPQPEEEREK